MIQRLIATIALGMVVVCTFAQTTFSKNYFKYTTNSDDSTTVTITDYTRTTTKDVTIDSTVTYSSVTYKITAIGSQAFTNDKVANLVLPATLVEIGDSAFFGCDQLTTVDASACVNLKRIGKAAFRASNGKFTSINLSNCSSLVTIGDSAFAGCTALTTLTGWNDLTNLDTIGIHAFNNCTVLKLALVLPSSIRYLGQAAFYYCKAITSIDLSACTQITEIGYGTFAYCNSSTLLQLPTSITKIGTYAFWKNAFQELDLSHLTKLGFIDNAAFYYCDSLLTITLPANLDSIGYWATFAACGNLQTVYLTNTKAMVKIVDGTDLGSTTIVTYQPFTIPKALEKIYVPKHLRVSYIEDEQWSTYKDYFDSFIPGSAKASLTIDEKQCYWGTYACDDPMDAPTNASFYDVRTINGSLLELEEVATTTVDDENVLPAGAYLVCSDVYTSKLYFFDYTGSETIEAHESNYLKGSSAGDTVSTDGYTYYIMSTRSGIPGFYYQNRSSWTGTALQGQSAGSGVIIDPYKAYLQIPTESSNSNGFSLTFAETQVEGIQEAQVATSNAGCYDLQGRRVNKPQRGGLYIRDGRKFIVL